MTNNDTHSPDELLPVTEDIEALAKDSEESHPFFQRDDLDTWQRAFYYDPSSGLDPLKQRKAIGKALRRKAPLTAMPNGNRLLNALIRWNSLQPAMLAARST